MALAFSNTSSLLVNIFFYSLVFGFKYTYFKGNSFKIKPYSSLIL